MAIIARLKFTGILFGLSQMLKFSARRHAAFRARLCERNMVAQLMARDERIGRWFEIRNGKLKSGAGLHPKPDVTLAFKSASHGAALLMPPIDWLDQINAIKDFNLTIDGPEDLSNWFAQTIMMSQTVGLKFGTPMPDGTMRYCNMTNGGPVFVYVKDGRILRMTPIDFDDTDPQPWTVEARGLKFTPPRKTTLAPHGQNAKSIVYSPDRLLHRATKRQREWQDWVRVALAIRRLAEPSSSRWALRGCCARSSPYMARAKVARNGMVTIGGWAKPFTFARPL